MDQENLGLMSFHKRMLLFTIFFILLGCACSADNQCVVCQNEIRNDQAVRTLPCRHVVHQECLVTWRVNHNTCPSCGTPIPNQNPRTGNLFQNLFRRVLTRTQRRDGNSGTINSFNSYSNDDANISSDGQTSTVINDQQMQRGVRNMGTVNCFNNYSNTEQNFSNSVINCGGPSGFINSFNNYSNENQNFSNMVIDGQHGIIHRFNSNDDQNYDNIINDGQSDTVISDGQSGSTDNACTVCLDGIQDYENVEPLACGHLFHQECLDQWLQSYDSCPSCSIPITHENPQAETVANAQHEQDEELVNAQHTTLENEQHERNEALENAQRTRDEARTNAQHTRDEALTNAQRTRDEALTNAQSRQENIIEREKSSYTDNDCTICLDGIQNDEDVEALACGHVFHRRCLAPWRQSHKSCPRCRTQITRENSQTQTAANAQRVRYEALANARRIRDEALANAQRTRDEALANAQREQDEALTHAKNRRENITARDNFQRATARARDNFQRATASARDHYQMEIDRAHVNLQSAFGLVNSFTNNGRPRHIQFLTEGSTAPAGRRGSTFTLNGMRVFMPDEDSDK